MRPDAPAGTWTSSSSPPPWPSAPFIEASAGADLAVIEGNRGLFDGMDPEGSFSSAELAKLLKAPVLLSVDVTKTTRTAAAQVLGCQTLDPEVPLAGVVLNRVAGQRHESVLRESIEGICGIPVLGAIPRLPDDLFPERHLGLVPPQETEEVEDPLSRGPGGRRKVPGPGQDSRAGPTAKPCLPQSREPRTGDPRSLASAARIPESGTEIRSLPASDNEHGPHRGLSGRRIPVLLPGEPGAPGPRPAGKLVEISPLEDSIPPGCGCPLSGWRVP